jgi:predicted dehydrogenase
MLDSRKKGEASTLAKTVGVALVGCGFFAVNHLHAWRHLADDVVVLVAVCDRDEERARTAAKTFGVPRWYTRLDEMIAAEQIDLLDITTRMDSHRHLVETAMRAGIATVVQKPMAPTWDDAVAMFDASRRADVFLAVHENFRFQTPLMRVSDIVRSGEIGAPSWARISFRTGYDIYSGQPYFYD